jgi:hypothetical protein
MAAAEGFIKAIDTNGKQHEALLIKQHEALLITSGRFGGVPQAQYGNKSYLKGWV